MSSVFNSTDGYVRISLTVEAEHKPSNKLLSKLFTKFLTNDQLQELNPSELLISVVPCTVSELIEPFKPKPFKPKGATNGYQIT